MSQLKNRRKLRLPKTWPGRVRSALLHVISLARFAGIATRSAAADSPDACIRLREENDRLEEEAALLREELRIKDGRMALIPPHRRPFYAPAARMEILELKSARGWNLEQTARAFLITSATIAAWMQRVDEQGSDALVQLRTPVNRYPEFVRHAVQRLKRLCPSLGKKKLAEVLARAGLHLSATTIGRLRREQPPPVRHDRLQCSPPYEGGEREGRFAKRVVTAKRPNHVWHVDLTTIPTSGGFWATWFPHALPQMWPFCWWIAVAVDHYSRRVMGVGVFYAPPTSAPIRAFLGRAITAAGTAPKHLICDKGSQFWCEGFKAWCVRRGIRPRFGAIGRHGSIAVVERFIRTLKHEGFCGLLIPFRRAAMRRELLRAVGWYNEHRPHATLGGRTPDEVYFRLFPANRRPRIEPRKPWPRGSPCARPQALVAGQPGDRFALEVAFVDGRRHLPLVTLRRAA